MLVKQAFLLYYQVKQSVLTTATVSPVGFADVLILLHTGCDPT